MYLRMNDYHVKVCHMCRLAKINTTIIVVNNEDILRVRIKDKPGGY